MVPFLQQNKRLFQIAGIIFALFVAGIIFAFFIPSDTSSPDTQPVGNQPSQFLDLRLGTPVRAEFASQKNPPIKQKSEYTVKEPIMLQGTTTSSATQPVEVTVRLVNELNTVVPLSPGSVTIQPGTNSFCCWNIESPGEYVIQIFRPDGVITRLPIRIVKDFESISSDK